MRIYCLSALIISACCIPQLFAAECPQDIQAVMTHLDFSDQYERIGFEVSHVGERDKFSRSERYEPLQPPEQRWVLLEMDGEKPSEKDRKQFARQQAERGNPFLSFLREAQPDQFKLAEQTPTRVHYQFQPSRIEVGTGDRGKLNVTEHVSASLTLLDDSDIGCVLNINFYSPESFSPRTGVKVKTFSLTHRFLLDDETGLFFPESNTLVLKGRAFLVAGFDVLNRATYSAVSVIQDEYAKQQNTLSLDQQAGDIPANSDQCQTETAQSEQVAAC